MNSYKISSKSNDIVEEKDVKIIHVASVPSAMNV